MDTPARIDALVGRLAERGTEFRPIRNAPWIEEVESRLGFKLPAIYRSLVTRYAFPTLTLEKVELFSNLGDGSEEDLALIHISEPTRLLSISYAVFCLKKKKKI